MSSNLLLASKWPARGSKRGSHAGSAAVSVMDHPMTVEPSGFNTPIMASPDLLSKRLAAIEAEKAEQALRLRVMPSHAIENVKDRLVDLTKRQHELETELANEAARAKLQPQMRVECDACESLHKRVVELEASHKDELDKFKDKAEEMTLELKAALDELTKIRAHDKHQKAKQQELEDKLHCEFESVVGLREEVSRKLKEWREASETEHDVFKRELADLKATVDNVLSDTQKVSTTFQELNLKYKTVGEAAVKAMKQIDGLKKQIVTVSEGQKETHRMTTLGNAKIAELERTLESMKDKASQCEDRMKEFDDLQENIRLQSVSLSSIKDSLDKSISKQHEFEKRDSEGQAAIQRVASEAGTIKDWIMAMRRSSAGSKTPIE